MNNRTVMRRSVYKLLSILLVAVYPTHIYNEISRTMVSKHKRDFFHLMNAHIKDLSFERIDKAEEVVNLLKKDPTKIVLVEKLTGHIDKARKQRHQFEDEKNIEAEHIAFASAEEHAFDAEKDSKELHQKLELALRMAEEMHKPMAQAQQELADIKGSINALTLQQKELIHKQEFENVRTLVSTLTAQQDNLLNKVTQLETVPTVIDTLKDNLKASVETLNTHLKTQTALVEQRVESTIKQTQQTNTTLITDLQAKITQLSEQLAAAQKEAISFRSADQQLYERMLTQLRSDLKTTEFAMVNNQVEHLSNLLTLKTESVEKMVHCSANTAQQEKNSALNELRAEISAVSERLRSAQKEVELAKKSEQLVQETVIAQLKSDLKSEKLAHENVIAQLKSDLKNVHDTLTVTQNELTRTKELELMLNSTKDLLTQTASHMKESEHRALLAQNSAQEKEQLIKGLRHELEVVNSTVSQVTDELKASKQPRPIGYFSFGSN